MEKTEISEKIPCSEGEWDLLEQFSAEWIGRKVDGKEYLSGPAHKHKWEERFVSTGEDFVLAYITERGKVKRLKSKRLLVGAEIPHQVLVPVTDFEIHTCQENLEHAETRERLEDFLV